MAPSSKKSARPAIMLDEPPNAAASFVSPPAFDPPVEVTDAPVSTAVSAEAFETAFEAPAFEAPAAEAAPAPFAEAEPEPGPVEAPNVAPVAAPEPQQSLEALVEKGVAERRMRFADARSAADSAAAAVEASVEAARQGVARFNIKTIEALKAGADAQFDLFASLAAAKTFSELVTIQTEFARARFEDASQRAKELADFARKVADDTVAPIKAQVAKTFKG